MPTKKQKLESEFNSELKAKLDNRFPGCVVIKQDPMTSFQGVPDHLVLYEDHWALLEAKRGGKADRQPNQPYHVNRLNELSFSAFINPDNCDEVLDDLERTWSAQ